MRMAGVDHIHAGTVVGKLEGDPKVIAGIYDICRETSCPRIRARHLLRSALGQPEKMMPVASGGIHAGQMHQLLHLSERGRGAAIRRRHDRPSDGHSGGRDGESRGAGNHGQGTKRGPRHLERGPEILNAAARWCQPLRAALDTWKDVSFDYTSTDSVDLLPPRPLPEEERIMRITQGQFSFLPDLTDEEMSRRSNMR